MKRKRSAWLALSASCLAVFLPGALIFGFPGVLSPYWQSTFGVGRADVGQVLFYILAGAGVFMFLIGRLQERIGSAWVIFLGALIGGAGMVMIAYADGIRWVYIWGFVNGASSAFAYLPALTVVQRWYPARRGLVTGLVSMSFGIAGAVMAPVFHLLLQTFDYTSTVLILGIGAAVVGSLVSILIHLPIEGTAKTNGEQPEMFAGQLSLTLMQSLRTRSFWLLWFTYAFAGAAGISMVTLSVNFGLDRGLGMPGAVLILASFNTTNGVGRLVSGFLSDMVGRRQIMGVSFLLAGVSCFLFPVIGGMAVWMFFAAVIGFSFGTLNAVTAPLVSDCFGMQNFGTIFGLVFTAFGFVSGAIGPWLSGFLLDATQGNFALVFIYLGSLLTAATLMIWITSPQTECTF